MADLITLAALVVEDLERRKRWALAAGVCDGEGLWVELPGGSDLYPGFGVVRCFMPAGSEFPPHIQEYCTEWLIVGGGELDVTTFEDDGTTILREVRLCPGDGWRVPPGQPHQARAHTDVTVIGVTVPRDGGYPDGPTHDARPARGVGAADGINGH